MLLALIACWGMAAFMGIKAFRAASAGSAYLFSFWDGGLLMRGREIRPRTAGLIAGGLAIFPVIGWFAVLSQY